MAQATNIRNPLQAVAWWHHDFHRMFSARVRTKQLGFRQTWYLGALTLGTFTTKVGTGLLLMLYYHPSIPQGYGDMKDLEFVVSSGANTLTQAQIKAVVAYIRAVADLPYQPPAM